ncbi:MAG: SAVED domain-containing protein, partial [Syntrophus sp. (in: bacteria)]
PTHNEVTRHIKREVERELWARAAGRCQFDGCNRLLFKSPITQEKVNISEMAHIYSFSKIGPRGWGPFITNKKQLNVVNNLMLVCHDCHKTIDQDKDGERYSAKLLLKWKDEHEKRISIVTGVDPTKNSQVILYRANIGDQTSRLQPEAAKDALFPDWYPAGEHPVHLSMNWEGKDSDPDYWKTEAENLNTAFNRQVRPLVDGNECPHLSLFALAPIPLMILFGSLLTDKVSAQTYQLHREPFQTWKWLSGPDNFTYIVNRPESSLHPPALVISLSDHIAPSRITAILGKSVSIWELTIACPHNDFLKSKDQLSMFRETARQLIVDIGKTHGKQTPLAIFPAIPVACAVDLGRVRMPKADGPWIIFDQNNKYNQFIRALDIGGPVHE